MNKLFDKMSKVVAIIFGVPIAILTLSVVLYSSSDGFKSFMDGLVKGNNDRVLIGEGTIDIEGDSVSAQTFTEEDSNALKSVNVELVSDPSEPELMYYKVTGMSMDYYIMQEAYGNANGKKDFEKTINDFLYAMLVKRDADETKKYITKADSRLLEEHENADEEYATMISSVDLIIQQLNMIEQPVLETSYGITKATQANIMGRDFTVVNLTYYIDIGSERPHKNLNLFMQKENGKWMIFSAR